MGIVLAIFVLGLVVALHEFGHFFVAKWCKVGVLEYALGFGKSLFSKRYGETKYSLRLIPLGGYVRMVGDDPFALMEAENPELAKEQEEAGAGVSSPEKWGQSQPDEVEQKMMADRSKWFLTKPVWAKAAIVFAGPFANLLSAFVFAVITLTIWGATVPMNEPIIGQIIPGYPAEKAGLKIKDRVTAIDGKELKTWDDLAGTVHKSGGKEFTMRVQREGADGKPGDMEIKITGIRDSAELKFIDESLVSDGFKIGVSPAGKRQQVTVVESAQMAVEHIWRLSVLTVKGIVGLAIGKISLKNIGGPIFIFGETMRSAHQGIADLLEFIVFLSVSLAVLNLLPIPVLDGGHLLFFLIEAIKGTPVSTRIIELSHQVGMVLLLALTALAVGNDFLRLVG